MENETKTSYGMKHIDYEDLSAFESVTMSVVGIMAVTFGVLIAELGVIA